MFFGALLPAERVLPAFFRRLLPMRRKLFCKQLLFAEKSVRSILLLVSVTLSFALSGCSKEEISSLSLPFKGPTPTPVQVKERVYMDEFQGTLKGFDGSWIRLVKEDTDYLFDISGASMELPLGPLSGQEVSLIYEGILNEEDPSTVKVLKVTEYMHPKEKLKEQGLKGTLDALTPNTALITWENGQKILFCTTGVCQYYQNGISPGMTVYVHFFGSLPAVPEEGGILDAKLIKVLSISDTEPLTPPEKKVSPSPVLKKDNEEAYYGEQESHGTFLTVDAESISYRPAASGTPLTISTSGIPCYFPAGFASLCGVTMVYMGTPGQNEEIDTSGIISLTGEDPDGMRTSQMNFAVSGTVVGTTGNTVSIRTSDGAFVTCRRDGVPDSSTSSLEERSQLCVTFDPGESRNTSILKSLRLQDP